MVCSGRMTLYSVRAILYTSAKDCFISVMIGRTCFELPESYYILSPLNKLKNYITCSKAIINKCCFLKKNQVHFG